MSGGHFEYAQYKIADIYNSIEEYLYGRELDECDVDEYIRDYYLEDNEKEYILQHHRTIPNRYEFSKETLAEFKKAVHILKQAEIYAQRIDWLLSGDDDEKSFHERLEEEMKKMNDDGTDEARQEAH